jgi:hypothetical protein
MTVTVFLVKPKCNEPLGHIGIMLRATIMQVEKDGYKVKRYYHRSEAYDYKLPLIYRMWVEFDTQEEAIEFKLKYL